MNERVCVAQGELAQFGCPYCGYRSGTMPIQAGGWGSWCCGDCGKGCDVLADGVEWTNMTTHAKLQKHPRFGIPSHGRPDKRPDGGGEFFRARGIGLDSTPGCFVCAKPRRTDDPAKSELMNNIAAFVQCKDAGERVAEMFNKRASSARVDYREREPDRVQLKVGACDAHIKNLKILLLLTELSGVVTDEIIAEAADLKLDQAILRVAHKLDRERYRAEVMSGLAHSFVQDLEANDQKELARDVERAKKYFDEKPWDKA